MPGDMNTRDADAADIFCAHCGNSFPVSLATHHLKVRCPSARCSLPYDFTFYDDLASATVEKQRIIDKGEAWTKPSIFPARGKITKWVVTYTDAPVQRFEPKRLRDLTHEYVLRAVQGGLADELGAPITILDIDEERPFYHIEPLQIHPKVATRLGLPAYHPPYMKHFSGFCLEARINSPNRCGNTLCFEQDERVARAIIEGTHRVESPYQCHAGLFDYAYPIRVQGTIFGVLFSGQKRVSTQEGELILRATLGGFAAKVGMTAERAIELVDQIERISSEEMEQFVRRVQDLAGTIAAVAEESYNTQRTTRDQLFLQEISGRFRNLTRLLKPNDRVTVPVLHLCRERVGAYVGASAVSVLYSVAPSGWDYHGETGTGPPEGPIAIAPQLFSSGAKDTDGLIDMLGPEKAELRERIRRMTPGLSEPAFLLRVILAGKAEMLIVFHGDIGTIPFAYRPGPENHLARRFYDSLTRLLQSEVDQLLDRMSVLDTLRKRETTLAMVAHGLWQPLRGIHLSLRHVVGRLSGTEPFYRFIRHSLNVCNRLWNSSSTILSTLSIQEIGEEFFSRTFQSRNIRPIFKQAIEIFGDEAENKGLVFLPIARVDDQPFPDIDMNYFAVSTAIQNLVYNAVKYSFQPPANSSKKREIKISCWHGPSPGGVPGYFMSIENWGVGIDVRRDGERIFEKHTRGSTAEDRFRIGSGLGLSQVRYAIETLHRGKVTFTSEPQGREIHHTTFTIFLPLKQEAG